MQLPDFEASNTFTDELKLRYRNETDAERFRSVVSSVILSGFPKISKLPVLVSNRGIAYSSANSEYIKNKLVIFASNGIADTKQNQPSELLLRTTLNESESKLRTIGRLRPTLSNTNTTEINTQIIASGAVQYRESFDATYSKTELLPKGLKCLEVSIANSVYLLPYPGVAAMSPKLEICAAPAPYKQHTSTLDPKLDNLLLTLSQLDYKAETSLTKRRTKALEYTNQKELAISLKSVELDCMTLVASSVRSSFHSLKFSPYTSAALEHVIAAKLLDTDTRNNLINDLNGSIKILSSSIKYQSTQNIVGESANRDLAYLNNAKIFRAAFEPMNDPKLINQLVHLNMPAESFDVISFSDALTINSESKKVDTSFVLKL